MKDRRPDDANFPREILEAALPQDRHRDENAHNHGDLPAKRAKLMEAWAGYSE